VRICFVAGEYPPMQGGVGDCTHELGRALMQLGHQVVVLTSQKAAPAHRQQNAAFADSILAVPEVCPVVPNWDWASWRHVLRTVCAYESDILHIQYQTAAYAMHPAINFLPLRLRLSRQRPRVLITFHDLRVPYLFPKAGVVRRWITRLPARWSDAVIATNSEDYEQLTRAHLPNTLRLIPIGSNIHPQPPPGYDRAAWRRHLGVLEDEVLLCYFGFLNESKGGETLLRSLAELVRRGRRAKLLMIGGQVGDSDPTNVAYLERIKALSSKLGLTELVLWTGYTPSDQVSANFLAADICVLPYRDGVSYRRGSFMAALAHGMPIVSTQPRTPNSTLADGESILLVPADHPLATADAVEKLVYTPVLRTRLARGALVLAKDFAWDHIAAQTAQLYSELLASSSIRRSMS